MSRRIPKISCSLLATFESNMALPEALKKLDMLGVDMIHYDVCDSSSSLCLEDIESLRQFTRLPFDVHLTAENPLSYLRDVKLDKNDYFCVHIESHLTLSQIKEIRRQVGCKFGLAIRTETPVGALYEKVHLVDYVLFMAATPGVPGGQFDYKVVDRIKMFRRRFSGVEVHVDGGVDHFSAALLRDIDVSVLVSGSYILRSNDFVAQIINLFGRNLYLKVSHIMRQAEEFPVIKPDDTVKKAAVEINNKRVGCVCVLDNDNHLLGLITDGDLRRGLIARPDLSNVKAKEIMIENPFTTSPDTSLLKLLREIEKESRSFTVVPVVDGNRRCRGLVWLQDILFSSII